MRRTITVSGRRASMRAPDPLYCGVRRLMSHETQRTLRDRPDCRFVDLDDVDAVDPSPNATALLVQLVHDPLAFAHLRMSAIRNVGHERDVGASVSRRGALVQLIVNRQ